MSSIESPHDEANQRANRPARRQSLAAGGPPVATPDAPAAPDRVEIGREVSRAIIRLVHQHTARGPAKVRTVLSSDLAVVTLHDCLTRGERTLATHGHGDVVTRTREALYDAIRPDATAIVEALTGRPVSAFLTDQVYEPDVAVFVFVFAAPSRPQVAH